MQKLIPQHSRDQLSSHREASLPPRPPAGLSKWARGVWTELLSDNVFAPHELMTFARALKWFDVSDRLLREAKVKAASDASTSALRLWRTLKFTDPSVPTRRPGRPPKSRWRADGGLA